MQRYEAWERYGGRGRERGQTNIPTVTCDRATRRDHRDHSHRLAIEDLLDIANVAGRLHWSAREYRESLLRRVQHLLDVRQDARNVWGDKGILLVV